MSLAYKRRCRAASYRADRDEYDFCDCVACDPESDSEPEIHEYSLDDLELEILQLASALGGQYEYGDDDELADELTDALVSAQEQFDARVQALYAAPLKGRARVQE